MGIRLYLVGEKGCHVLTELCVQYGAQRVECVVAARDGGVVNDFFEEIKAYCISKAIRFFERGDSGIMPASGYAFAVGWKWMIPQEDKLIVFHDSILPRYRGFSPLVNMLINGEPEIGVTALLASQKYDEGPVVAQEKIAVNYPVKICSAIKSISMLYANLACSIAGQVFAGGVVVGHAQDVSLATYSLWRDEDDYFIDWSESADKIKRTCDALGYPYRGACTYAGRSLIRVLDVDVVPDVIVESRWANLGKIIFYDEAGPVVVCGSGLVRLRAFRSECGIERFGFRTRFSSYGMRKA
jgi:methionyl-tRNA formyltransferase